LSDEAKRLCGEILRNKPADYFDADPLPLLAQYCDALAEHAKLVQQRNEMNLLKAVRLLQKTALVHARARLNRAIIDQSNSCGTLATKLRLTVQAVVDRKSGILNEHPPPDDDDRLFAGRRLDN
jgi:hypothetical protein